MPDVNKIPDYSDDWYEDEELEDQDIGYVEEYDITAAPNDFNIRTIFDFIESGAVKIPGFQRNYVWDQRRASKLIESIIIGLPIPQVFLYEESRNKFLVIDGQQRLMTIYYFIKKRFPKKEKRAALRTIFSEHGKIPDEILYNDEYFSKFNLQLIAKLPDVPNKFNKLNYSTLGEFKTQFDLRTIRNVIIKQNIPKDDDSSIYEIFNRLNSGGINLKPQEIRVSLYHSDFYKMLARINLNASWRWLLGLEEPDLHMKDIEILLRCFAMLIEGGKYKPSMTKFLNGFSKNSKAIDGERIEYLEKLFESFINSCQALPKEAFLSKSLKFNISLFDSTFAAICGTVFCSRELVSEPVNHEKLIQLQNDPEFIEASKSDTASKANVEKRLLKARDYLLS
jgi:uncharacterized protein with ParB-like and HNH nuclease domain